MGVLVQGCLLLLLVKSYLFIKILTTNKMDYDDVTTDSFTRINVSTPVLSNISTCQWISMAFEDLGAVWISENNKFFDIIIKSAAKYLGIGKFSVRVEFPKDFFVPDKWFFYCFTYNNMEKSLEVYLNSEKIFKKTVKMHRDSFVIDQNFLQNEKFGQAGSFAGQLTDFNIWSRILNHSEIKMLYKCEHLEEGPDIVNWKSSELVPGRNIVVSEMQHPCSEYPDNESQTMIYDVELSMEPALQPLRVCDALGGTMDLPTSVEERQKLREKCKSCARVWIPIFRKSEEELVDRENEVVQNIPWSIGQPNGGDYEKCVTLHYKDTLPYFDGVCKNPNNFYCKIKDFQVIC